MSLPDPLWQGISIRRIREDRTGSPVPLQSVVVLREKPITLEIFVRSARIKLKIEFFVDFIEQPLRGSPVFLI